MTDFVEAGHLGGYIPGGDEATWYPHLWRWLVDTLNVKTVLDVGCGEGFTVDYFRSQNVAAVGIEGVPQHNPHVTQHDYTTGGHPASLQSWFDLVWSCEFVEHVEEQYVPNFVSSFRTGRYVLMTHAEPGQAGYHHVNCQTADYWKGVMAAVGYHLDSDLTDSARVAAGMNTSPWNHFARCGLAFVRNP